MDSVYYSICEEIHEVIVILMLYTFVTRPNTIRNLVVY